MGVGIQGASVRVADVIIGAILLVSLIVRLALLTGPTGSDDVNYHFAQILLHSQHFTELDLIIEENEGGATYSRKGAA